MKREETYLLGLAAAICVVAAVVAVNLGGKARSRIVKDVAILETVCTGDVQRAGLLYRALLDSAYRLPADTSGRNAAIADALARRYDLCRDVLRNRQTPMYLVTCRWKRDRYDSWSDTCVMVHSLVEPSIYSAIRKKGPEAHGREMASVLRGEIPVVTVRKKHVLKIPPKPERPQIDHKATPPDDGMFGFDPWDDWDDLYDIDRMFSDPWYPNIY